MAATVLDTLNRLVTPQLVGAASTRLGESERAVSKEARCGRSHDPGGADATIERPEPALTAHESADRAGTLVLSAEPQRWIAVTAPRRPTTPRARARRRSTPSSARTNTPSTARHNGGS